MDKKQSLELCAALSNAKGAPGFEDEVLTVLRRYGEGLGSFREDSLRNLYLSRSGNQGVPVIVIGIPVRYIHTHYGIAAHSDVENAARLAAAILERMDAAQISRF